MAKCFLIINYVFFFRSNNDNDLEDGEIPSDEDDEPVTRAQTEVTESAKPSPKQDVSKNKNFDSKFNKNKKQPIQGTTAKHDRYLKYKSPTEDWAGDVEKAIRAALEEDGGRNTDSKSKNKTNRNKSRKRVRDERDEDRSKDQKVTFYTILFASNFFLGLVFNEYINDTSLTIFIETKIK